MGGLTRYRISLEGIVQGVGFRPFVKRLADRFDLSGIAYNTAGGLIVEVETEFEDVARRFITAIGTEALPASKIERCGAQELAQPAGYDSFRIIPSASRGRSFTLIPPDLATCPACLKEIRNPADRRFAILHELPTAVPVTPFHSPPHTTGSAQP